MGMMMNKLGIGFLALLMALATSAAIASPHGMVTGGRSTQPVGHYDFCRQTPSECKKHASRDAAPVELTRELWAELIDVNNAINATITPLTDFEIWGVEEVWSYPVNGVGDCEDYVLEKRRMLRDMGIPIGNLLITVVRQPNGDGHAVLTVRTNLGDFVLDNLEPRILAWQDTEYTFLKRQSSTHAGVWLGIEDSRGMAVGSVGR